MAQQYDPMTGLPFPGSLPDAPGNFTESEIRPPSDTSQAPVFKPLTPTEQADERMRLNFEHARGETLAGGATTLTAQRRATNLAFPAQEIPGIADAPNGNLFAFSPGEQNIVSEDTQADAKRTLSQLRADELAYKNMPSFQGFGQGVGSLAAQLTGMIASPENLIDAPVAIGTRVWRATHPFLSSVIGNGITQALVQAGTDPLTQAAQIKAGIKKDYDIAQTSLAIPTGFVFGGGISALSHAGRILYESGADALAGKLTERIPALSAELKAPIPPAPAQVPIEMLRETAATRVAPHVKSNEARVAAREELPSVIRQEPPIADGNVRLYTTEPVGEAKPGQHVTFSRDVTHAEQTTGGKALGKEVSYIDVPEDVALAKSAGNDHVALPQEVAAASQPLPKAEPIQPAKMNDTQLAAINAERDTLTAKIDELDTKLMNEAWPRARARMQAKLAPLEKRLDEIKLVRSQHAEAVKAEAASVRTNDAAGNEVAPRLKGMGGNTTGHGSGRSITKHAAFPDDLAPQVDNMMDVMRRTAESLNMIVRKGRLRAPGQNMAEYNFGTQITRLSANGDQAFRDFTHELGHHVEAVFGADPKNPITALMNSDLNAMRAFGGPMTQNLNPRDTASEGFSEFMVAYITARERAVQISPSFVQKFQDTLGRENPELLSVLDAAHAAWHNYQHAPSRSAVASNIVSTMDIPDKPEFKDPLKRSAFALWVSNAYTVAVNRQHPLSIAQRMLGEAFEKKYGRLLNRDELGPDKNPVVLAQLFARNGGSQIAMMDLQHGVTDAITLRPSGPAWNDIMKKATSDVTTGLEAFDGKVVGARWLAFDSYLAAKWHLNLEKQISDGKLNLNAPPSGIRSADATRTVEEMTRLNPHFPALAEEMYQFNKNLVKKRWDAGLLTREDYDYRMHPDNHEYVPFHRDMREVTESVKGGNIGKTGGGLEILNQFARQGSTRRIISPTEAIMLETFLVNDQMTENWIKVSLRDLIRLVGGKEAAAIAEEIPNTAMRRIDIDVAQGIRSALLANGHTPHDAKVMADQIIADIGPNTRTQLYHSEAIKSGGKPIIFGWDKGERFALQLADGGFGRQLQEVMDGLGPRGVQAWTQALGVGFDLLAASAGVLRGGATGTVTFAVKNTIRDAFMQYLLTPEAGIKSLGFANTASGLSSFLKKDESYIWYNALGGIKGGVAANAMQDSGKVAQAMQMLGVEGHKILTFQNMKGLMEKLEVSETAGRIGLFKVIYDANKELGRTDRYALFDAAQKARDFTDYGRFGSRMEIMSRLVPFLNANIQGIDRFVRVFGTPTNPGAFFGKATTEAQAELKQQLRTQIMPRVMAFAAFSVAVEYAYMDDPMVQKIQPELRAKNWIFRLPFIGSGVVDLAGGGQVNLPQGMQGGWIIIPKPFEFASIFNFAEHAVRFVNSGDPQKIADFMKSLATTFNLPSMTQLPGVFGTMSNIKANNDPYFEKPIVPSHMAGKIAPHFQADQYTGQFYKSLANALDSVWNSQDAHKTMNKIPIVGAALGALWSPMEAQYLAQGALGDVPRELGGAINVVKSMFSGEVPKVEDVPGLRGIIRTKMASGEPLREVYNQVGQNQGRLTVASETFKSKIVTDPAAAQTYFNSLDSDQRDYVRLKVLPKAPLVAALHPAERASNLNAVVRDVRNGLHAEGGLVALSDPTRRIKVEPGLRDVVIEALNDVAGIEAQNSMTVQGVSGYQSRAITDTKPYFDMIKQASPELAKEISARMAEKKVFNIETVQKFWPQAQKEVRVGGTGEEVAGRVRGLGFQAASEGYVGGGRLSGRKPVDSDGAKATRARRVYPAFAPEGAKQ